MNSNIFLFVLFFLASVFAIQKDVEASVVAKFKAFVTKYEKNYERSEMSKRFKIFQENLLRIEELNAKNSSAIFGVNQFADLSQEEFRTMYLSTHVPMREVNWPVAPMLPPSKVKTVPDTWDWRDHGAVTDVKDQGSCGSCWAFSTTGNVEGQWALAGNQLVGLSEQNLVDCDQVCSNGSCDSGCEGGLMSNAFTYIMQNGGIDTESSYPYQGVDGSCHYSASNIGAKVKNWTFVPSDETQMKAYTYNQGPISIAVDATLWQFYIEGIFDFPWCGSDLDHGVLIVGYGNGLNLFWEPTDFWTIKNSWGTSWGESGYIRMARGEAMCGVTLFPCTSFVK